MIPSNEMVIKTVIIVKVPNKFQEKPFSVTKKTNMDNKNEITVKNINGALCAAAFFWVVNPNKCLEPM